MTAGGMIQALGMREVRGNMRAVVARVEEGEALVVLRDGQPSAVMLAFAEAQRWQQIERAPVRAPRPRDLPGARPRHARAGPDRAARDAAVGRRGAPAR